MRATRRPPLLNRGEDIRAAGRRAEVARQGVGRAVPLQIEHDLPVRDVVGR